MKNKITINLSERSYDILIGKDIIGDISQFLLTRKYSKIFVITDKNVANIHLNNLKKFLVNFDLLEVENGEKSKSFDNFSNLCNQILKRGIDRKSLIVAFGGGVVGDLAGFVASVLLRGIDFVQIPTTLLACVDSSVGGKTAINSQYGKNLIGSFYQPKLVICDLDFLTTLPDREFKSGYAEILKYGLIYDANFFNFLDQNYQKILLKDRDLLQKSIHQSCLIKSAIVSKDEKENGERALLNFGHSFAHIFETETNYSGEILHGEAVALGMAMATKMSLNFGLINQDSYQKIITHLNKCGFIINPNKIRLNWHKENLIQHIYKDKKNENNKLTFILLNDIGKATIRKNVDINDFLKILNEFIEN
jgi:3-dehydroquinate synthase